MKKLSLLLLLVLGLFINGYNQARNISNTLGEMLLSDDALMAAMQNVDANVIDEAAQELKYHLSYVIGDKAATIPDLRKIFFSSQCKNAMTAVTQELDKAGLTAELLRIAPDFLGTYAFADNETFAQNLVTALASYHITPAHLSADMPEVIAAQSRFEASHELPVATLLANGMLPLLEKCLNADNNTQAQNENGPIVHPFTIGTHTTKKGYSAGGALMVLGLTDMIESAKQKNPEQLTQAVATIMAVWVNVPVETSF